MDESVYQTVLEAILIPPDDGLGTGIYNGHVQLEMKIGMSYELAKNICKVLEKLYYEKEGKDVSVVCEIWADGSGNFVAKDYWKPGEHNLGHTDKLVLGYSPL